MAVELQGSGWLRRPYLLVPLTYFGGTIPGAAVKKEAASPSPSPSLWGCPAEPCRDEEEMLEMFRAQRKP